MDFQPARVREAKSTKKDKREIFSFFSNAIWMNIQDRFADKDQNYGSREL